MARCAAHDSTGRPGRAPAERTAARHDATPGSPVHALCRPTRGPPPGPPALRFPNPKDSLGIKSRRYSSVRFSEPDRNAATFAPGECEAARGSVAAPPVDNAQHEHINLDWLPRDQTSHAGPRKGNHRPLLKPLLTARSASADRPRLDPPADDSSVSRRTIHVALAATLTFTCC